MRELATSENTAFQRTRRAMLSKTLAVALGTVWGAGRAEAQNSPAQSTAQAPSPANLPLPERADLSHLLGPARLQGERDTCTAFATIAAVEAAFKRDREIGRAHV